MTHSAPPDPAQVLAIVCLDGDPTRWAATVLSLVETESTDVLVISEKPDHVTRVLGHLPIQVEGWPLSHAGGVAAAGTWQAVVVVTSPVVVPRDAWTRALQFLDGDLRTASVSFWSNYAGYLSLPHRNRDHPLLPEGHDQSTVTRLFRESQRLQDAVPIPVPAGGAVLFATAVLRVVGSFDQSAPSQVAAVIGLALTAARRGFRNVLDPTTFLARPAEYVERTPVMLDPVALAWLAHRMPWVLAVYEHERDEPESPLGIAVALRRAELMGIRVMIDASCLGPYETGTQVAILAQVEAMCTDDRIREIAVGVPDARVPDYGRRVLGHHKVRIVDSSGLTFADVSGYDVLHRPFQPSPDIPLDRWRAVARRVVISVLDAIAYDNGAYFSSAAEWLDYREGMAAAIDGADAITTISQDVARTLGDRHLGVRPGRLYLVENGVDHPYLDVAAERPPIELLERAATATTYLLVLGTAYAHKNRDLAIAAWHEIRRRGWDVRLVIAGVVVPYGSSRNEEVLATSHGEFPIVIADVTTAERDWLVRHAAVMVYPTSAEGFGLVPFEAAHFDTPTAFVGFGPVAELIGGAPVVARNWDASSLADAVEQLLADPAAARSQVEFIRSAGKKFTWAAAAEKFIDVYFDVLASTRAQRPSDGKQ